MKVAAVLDCYSVAINAGSDAGMKAGDLVCIVSDDVIDPETGDGLGRYPRVRLKVTETYPNFCVAETYFRLGHGSRTVKVNIGDVVEAQ